MTRITSLPCCDVPPHTCIWVGKAPRLFFHSHNCFSLCSLILSRSFLHVLCSNIIQLLAFYFKAYLVCDFFFFGNGTNGNDGGKITSPFYLPCILFTSTAARPGCRRVPPCCQCDAAFQNLFPFLSIGTQVFTCFTHTYSSNKSWIHHKRTEFMQSETPPEQLLPFLVLFQLHLTLFPYLFSGFQTVHTNSGPAIRRNHSMLSGQSDKKDDGGLHNWQLHSFGIATSAKPISRRAARGLEPNPTPDPLHRQAWLWLLLPSKLSPVRWHMAQGRIYPPLTFLCSHIHLCTLLDARMGIRIIND